MGAAVATLAIDRISKIVVIDRLSDGHEVQIFGKLLSFRLVLNGGSAFGLFPGATLAIFALSSLLVVAATIWAIKTREHTFAAGLIIGGGTGNLVDRLLNAPGPMHGRVVDFIDVSFWPTFNVADAAIVVGVALFILSSRKVGQHDPDSTDRRSDQPEGGSF